MLNYQRVIDPPLVSLSHGHGHSLQKSVAYPIKKVMAVNYGYEYHWWKVGWTSKYETICFRTYNPNIPLVHTQMMCLLFMSMSSCLVALDQLNDIYNINIYIYYYYYYYSMIYPKSWFHLLNNGLPLGSDFSVTMSSHVFAMRLLPEAGFFARTQGATEGDQVEFQPWASRFGASGRKTAAKIQRLVNLKLQNEDSIWFENIWDMNCSSNLR